MTHRERDFPSSGSLSQWLQQPGLGWLKEGATSGSPTCVARTQALRSSYAAFTGSLPGNCVGNSSWTLTSTLIKDVGVASSGLCHSTTMLALMLTQLMCKQQRSL